MLVLNNREGRDRHVLPITGKGKYPSVSGKTA